MTKNKAEVKEKFADVEYPLHVVGRHLSITEPMKSYAVDKLVKMEKFGGRIVDATITMDIQKQTHSVDFLLNVNNVQVKVSGQTRDMYSAVDQAIERLKNKLSRYMHRIHEHHGKGLPEIEMQVNVVQSGPLDEINDAIEEQNLKEMEASLKPGEIVSTEKRSLKILTSEEAVMKMQLSEGPFIVYRDESSRKLRVMYRREEDRNYGIIELPE